MKLLLALFYFLALCSAKFSGKKWPLKRFPGNPEYGVVPRALRKWGQLPPTSSVLAPFLLWVRNESLIWEPGHTSHIHGGQSSVDTLHRVCLWFNDLFIFQQISHIDKYQFLFVCIPRNWFFISSFQRQMNKKVCLRKVQSVHGCKRKNKQINGL